MTRLLRFLSFAWILSPVFAQAPAASSGQPQPITTFRAQTELVTVPVVVAGKDGKHLTGLKKTDFIVEENRHRREIASFEEVTPKTDSYHLSARPALEYANFVPPGSDVRRVTIVVLDLLNTPFMHQADTRKRLIDFLVSHVEDTGPTSLSILTSRGLRQVHSFTSDTSVLVEALKKVNSTLSAQDEIANGAAVDPESSNSLDDPSAGNDPFSQAAVMQEILAERTDALFGAYKQKVQTLTTLSALEEISQAYSGIPGRKSLIWATGGLPFLLNDPDSITGIDTQLMDSYQRTWRSLNSANIAVYPVDAQGLVPPDLSRRAMKSIGPSMPTNSRRGMSPPKALPVSALQNSQDSLRAFAQATGGKACLNNNDLAGCFARAADDSSQYYLLSYYLPVEDRKPGWHKLKVEVLQAHGEVRARDGFFVGDGKAAEEKSLIAQFDLAASSPLDYTAIPLGVRIKGISDAANGGHTVSFLILVQPSGTTIDTTANNHFSLELNAVAEDKKGHLTRVFGRTMSGDLKPETAALIGKAGLSFSGDINLPPGAYRQMRFVVRDGLSGNIGTVTAPLQMQPTPAPNPQPSK